MPGLPGCWSQGATEEEAIENIRDAIHEYLAEVNDLFPDAQVREDLGYHNVKAALSPNGRVLKLTGLNKELQKEILALVKAHFSQMVSVHRDQLKGAPTGAPLRIDEMRRSVGADLCVCPLNDEPGWSAALASLVR